MDDSEKKEKCDQAHAKLSEAQNRLATAAEDLAAATAGKSGAIAALAVLETVGNSGDLDLDSARDALAEANAIPFDTEDRDTAIHQAEARVTDVENRINAWSNDLEDAKNKVESLTEEERQAQRQYDVHVRQIEEAESEISMFCG